MAIPQHVVKTALGDLQVTLTSDKIDGQLWDTSVKVAAPGTLCVVAFRDRDKFLQELQEVINRYRI